jgi:hypothetical protein
MQKYTLKTNLAKIFLMLILAACPSIVKAQQQKRKMVASGVNAEKIITEDKLRRNIEFLTDPQFEGRRTGTLGATEAAFWIARKFMSDSLMPINGRWSQSFKVGDVVGHNIMGFMPGRRDREYQLYTIITAHYDSYGMMNGVLYPGADSNASGVVAMTSIADMFTRMKQLNRTYGDNLIFVAFDAREMNSAGADAFWNALSSGQLNNPVSGDTIRVDKIHALVSLDILGSTLSPLRKDRKDYLIMLSNGHFSADLDDANARKGLGLDVSLNYYGSENFTKMFHDKVGDQRIFVENGVHCAVFTSGITMNTNKPTDTAKTLNYNIFKKRIFLIFHWLTKMM